MRRLCAPFGHRIPNGEPRDMCRVSVSYVTASLHPDPTPVRTFSTRVVVAIVASLLAWASAFIVIRGVGHHFSPGALALGRMLVGAAALGVLMIGRRWVRPTTREWLLIAGYGALWFGVYNVALNLAEQTVDAGTASMIVNIGPLLIAVGSVLVLGERLHRPLVFGLVIAFVGVLLIGFANGASAAHLGWGVVAALAAAVTSAVAVLFQKKALVRIPVAQATFTGAVAGVILCLPFAGDLVRDTAEADPGAIAGVVYLGLVPTAVAFSTWGYALKRVPAAQLGVTTYIVPPLVIVAGLLFFGEAPAVAAVVGGALCLVGVAVSRRKARAEL